MDTKNKVFSASYGISGTPAEVTSVTSMPLEDSVSRIIIESANGTRLVYKPIIGTIEQCQDFIRHRFDQSNLESLVAGMYNVEIKFKGIIIDSALDSEKD